MFCPITRNISIPGTQVVPVALYHVLDGKHSRDYVARVEPSATGGSKMAQYILHMIDQSDSTSAPSETGYIRDASAPPPAYMSERV